MCCNSRNDARAWVSVEQCVELLHRALDLGSPERDVLGRGHPAAAHGLVPPGVGQLPLRTLGGALGSSNRVLTGATAPGRAVFDGSACTSDPAAAATSLAAVTVGRLGRVRHASAP